jgi:hypothetical protein
MGEIVITAIDIIFYIVMAFMFLLVWSLPAMMRDMRFRSWPVASFPFFILVFPGRLRLLLGGSRCKMCGGRGPPLVRLGDRGRIGPVCLRCAERHPILSVHSCKASRWFRYARRSKW